VKSNKLWDWITFGVFFFSLSILLWVTIKTATAEQLTGTSRFVAEDFFRGKLYELNEGEYFQTEKDCNLPSFAQVVVTNTGLFHSASYAFSGGIQSTVHWKTEKTTIDSCTQNTCDNTIETTSTMWHSCNLVGLIGGERVITESCNNDYPVYLMDTGSLYIFNTRIYEGFRESGIVIPEVTLRLNETGCFDIKEIPQ